MPPQSHLMFEIMSSAAKGPQYPQQMEATLALLVQGIHVVTTHIQQWLYH